ncbi:MAG: hypothetical protein D6748_13235 [Calditrichaeota bacterium]|nr:MAG: hypothetical protein D6748_13235 [Calditrichota bacterium]
MICKVCTGFVEQGQESCPHCGSPLESPSANKQKQRYYCKRCYRFLPSRICPIHGTEATIGIDQETLKSEARPLGGKDVPNEPPPAEPIVTPTPQNGNISPEDSPPEDDLFLNRILEDVLKESDIPRSEESKPDHSESFFTSSGEEEQDKDLADSLLGGLIEEKFQTLKKERDTQSRPPKEEKRSYSTPPKSPPPRRKPAPSPKSPKTSTSIFASIRKNSSRLLIGLAVLVGILLIAVVGIGVKNYLKPKLDRAALLQQADENFQQQNYTAALQLYSQFQDQFPQAPEINSVKERIASISSILENRQKNLALLQSLEKQALQAFETGQIVSPEEDNVLSYLNQMLQIDPTYGPALELENQVIEYLLAEAENAFNESRYDDALENYKQILTLKPDDTQLLDEIEKTLKLKNIQEMLQNLSEISKTRAEIQNLQQERIRLQAQLKRERSRFQQLTKDRKSNSLTSATPTRKKNTASRPTTRKPRSTQPLAEKKSTTPRRNSTTPATRPKTTTTAKKTPTTSASQNEPVENLLGIELLPTEEANTNDSEQPPVIDEKLIDGGEKQYVHKETPRLPPSVKKGDMLMILAECVVSVKGNVESVKLLTPLDDERINQVALNALKNYRFKPATFRGKPVRFKTVEVMTF